MWPYKNIINNVTSDASPDASPDVLGDISYIYLHIVSYCKFYHYQLGIISCLCCFVVVFFTVHNAAHRFLRGIHFLLLALKVVSYVAKSHNYAISSYYVSHC